MIFYSIDKMDENKSQPQFNPKSLSLKIKQQKLEKIGLEKFYHTDHKFWKLLYNSWLMILIDFLPSFVSFYHLQNLVSSKERDKLRER